MGGKKCCVIFINSVYQFGFRSLIKHTHCRVLTNFTHGLFVFNCLFSCIRSKLHLTKCRRNHPFVERFCFIYRNILSKQKWRISRIEEYVYRYNSIFKTTITTNRTNNSRCILISQWVYLNINKYLVTPIYILRWIAFKFSYYNHANRISLRC